MLEKSSPAVSIEEEILITAGAMKGDHKRKGTIPFWDILTNRQLRTKCAHHTP